jgi:exodeoxyribonuclease V alpha subunit
MQATSERTRTSVASGYFSQVRANARNYSEEKTISGKIAHLYHQSEGFTTGVISAPESCPTSPDCKFAIKGTVGLNETVTLHGAWSEHPKYGWQFAVTSVSYPMPDVSTDGLADYLANNPAFHNIGPVKARKIADAFGESFDSILREHPEKIAEIGKLKIEDVHTLQAEWCRRADINAIATWLAAFGLTHKQIERIAEKYGNRAKAILEENPYVLCDDLHGYAFARTDIVALKMGTPKQHPGRIRACVMDILKSEAQDGHTYTTRAALVRTAVGKLAFDTLESEQLIRNEISNLCAEETVEEDESGGAIRTHRMVSREVNGNILLAWGKVFCQETDLMNWFAEASQDASQIEDTDTTINDYLQSVGIKPNIDQIDAIRMAITNRVSVLSGGAGTGKSFTVAAIRKIFTTGGIEVAMCAPTGKAAKRMSQLASGAAASTIHKLLGYGPDDRGRMGFEYDENNKLPYGLIIVDEVSMCDVSLLWHLFSAIDLRSTQVLLVGDHNQLPPIGAGNVLRDVLTVGILPYTILTECIRAAGDLKLNCNAILAGELRPTTPVLPAGGREWRLVNSLEDPARVVEALRMLLTDKLATWGYDPIAECQIITPYNKGPLGVTRINAELQYTWQEHKYKKQLPEVPKEEKLIRRQFYVGDPVMQIKNDYNLGDPTAGGVMNGTQGIVTAVDARGSKQVLCIQFEDQPGPVEIEMGSDKEKNVVLAYAVTIHKVQGSEYSCVVAIIHSQHTYMLSRNLIYTAATRAKKTAILIGNAVGMRRAVRTTKPMERRTWMSLGVVVKEVAS